MSLAEKLSDFLIGIEFTPGDKKNSFDRELTPHSSIRIRFIENDENKIEGDISVFICEKQMSEYVKGEDLFTVRLHSGTININRIKKELSKIRNIWK